MKSKLDELLALRPAKVGVAEYEGAIAAIAAKQKAFAAEADELRVKRKTSLLSISGEALVALEDQARALDVAVEQATAILAELEEHLVEIRGADKAAIFVRRRQLLMEKQADFRRRFHEVYDKVAPQLKGLFVEYDDLAAQAEALNSSKPSRSVAGVPRFAICSSYRERMCLPEIGLGLDEDYRTPMLHVGSFWKPCFIEGPRPMKVDEEAAAARNAEYRQMIERDQKRAVVGRVETVVRGSESVGILHPHDNANA